MLVHIYAGLYSLYKVLASTIGLQLPRSDASPFLCMSTRHDLFHAAGVLAQKVYCHVVLVSPCGLGIAMWAAQAALAKQMFQKFIWNAVWSSAFMFGSLLTCC